MTAREVIAVVTVLAYLVAYFVACVMHSGLAQVVAFAVAVVAVATTELARD